MKKSRNGKNKRGSVKAGKIPGFDRLKKKEKTVQPGKGKKSVSPSEKMAMNAIRLELEELSALIEKLSKKKAEEKAAKLPCEEMYIGLHLKFTADLVESLNNLSSKLKDHSCENLEDMLGSINNLKREIYDINLLNLSVMEKSDSVQRIKTLTLNCLNSGNKNETFCLMIKEETERIENLKTINRTEFEKLGGNKNKAEPVFVMMEKSIEEYLEGIRLLEQSVNKRDPFLIYESLSKIKKSDENLEKLMNGGF